MIADTQPYIHPAPLAKCIDKPSFSPTLINGSARYTVYYHPPADMNLFRTTLVFILLLFFKPVDIQAQARHGTALCTNPPPWKVHIQNGNGLWKFWLSCTKVRRLFAGYEQKDSEGLTENSRYFANHVWLINCKPPSRKKRYENCNSQFFQNLKRGDVLVVEMPPMHEPYPAAHNTPPDESSE